MTANQAGPWSMPSPEPAPEPGDARPAGGKQVSSAGYWISGLILVLGFGGAIVWFVVVIVGAVSAPSGYDRVDIPGTLTTTLDSGTHTVFYEYPTTATSTLSSSPPDVKVTGPDGKRVVLDTAFVTSSYTWNGREGRSIAQFEAERSGAYTITVSGEPRPANYKIAVGKAFDFGSIAGIFGAMALGGVSFVVGITVLIVTIVRRSRVRRASAPKLPPYGGPGNYPGPGAPYPGTYPPGNYPPGGYPPQAYPPGGYPPTSWPPPSVPQPSPSPQPGWGPPAAPPPAAPPPAAPPPAAPPPAAPPPAAPPASDDRPGGDAAPQWPWSPPGEGGTTQQS